jgi:hypothetical protein
MELYVPSYVRDQLRARSDEGLRDQAMALVDRLQDTLDEAVPRLVAIAGPDGGRLMTAAAFMLRANVLLRGARAVERQLEVCALALRSVVELAIVGRYFVTGPDASDEFAARIRAGHEQETRLASQIGSTNAPLPGFLQSVAASSTRGPRTLADLARRLDGVDRRSPGAEGSLLYMYRLLYQYSSNVLTHANALSIKRYTDRHGDVLLLRHPTEPAISTPNILAAACLIGDLAFDLFPALQMSTDGLPSEIHRPRSSPSG